MRMDEVTDSPLLLGLELIEPMFRQCKAWATGMIDIKMVLTLVLPV